MLRNRNRMETDKNRDHLRSSRSEWRTKLLQSMIRKKQEWMPISRRSGEREREREREREDDRRRRGVWHLVNLQKGKHKKSQTKKKLQWCSVCGPTQRKVKTRRFGSSPTMFLSTIHRQNRPLHFLLWQNRFCGCRIVVSDRRTHGRSEFIYEIGHAFLHACVLRD